MCPNNGLTVTTSTFYTTLSLEIDSDSTTPEKYKCKTSTSFHRELVVSKLTYLTNGK
jgi:hypothetical protein